MQGHKWFLKEDLEIKEVSLKRLYPVHFHLYDILEKAKLYIQ